MNTLAALIPWLAAQTGLPAYARVPETRPATFITVERIGGGAQQFVDRPVLAIQAWAPTEYEAATLADTLRDVIVRAPEIPQIADADVEGIYSWPDPDSRSARYQIVAHLAVKWNH